jgi:hypothetical protein
MCSSTFWIFIVILILFSIYYLYQIKNKSVEVEEGFDMYQQLPFQYMYTGSEPLSYYRLDRYRLPYRYPDVFYTNYPVPYFRYYD